MPRTFAIGDIHGCSKTLQALVNEEIDVKPGDTLYFIGDYIDRGPDSKGVIDFILELQSLGIIVNPLRGNHEQMMLESVRSESDYNHWLLNGGEETLHSFGVESFDKMDQQYQTFFQNTNFIFQTTNVIYVHAGLNFENDDIFEDKHAMMWIRHRPIHTEKLKGKMLIHGHTPQPVDLIITQSGPVLNIDAGCVYTERPGYGYLVAYEIGIKKFFAIRNCEK